MSSVDDSGLIFDDLIDGGDEFFPEGEGAEHRVGLANFNTPSKVDNAGLVNGAEAGDAWRIRDGRLIVPLANAGVAGLISGAEWREGPAGVDDGIVHFPPFVPPSSVDALANFNASSVDDNAGQVNSIEYTSNVDSPRIVNGGIQLPQSLRGIWTMDEAQASLSGVDSSMGNPGGYTVPWGCMVSPMALGAAGVECGDMIINLDTGSGQAAAYVTMYACISPEGYLRFAFVQQF